MSIVRLILGQTGGPRSSPSVVDLIQDKERYFHDFTAYLIGLVGLAQMAEASNSGHATPYRSQDTVVISCKQSANEWIWRPEPAISCFTKNFSPTEIFLQKFPSTLPSPHSSLQLGAMNALMHNFGQALATNYFERHRPTIQSKYGKRNSRWPSVWDFARVVRNAMSHGGVISFDNLAAPSVCWKNLSYSPSDNGRAILHEDLWPGDIFDLIQEMDAAL